MTSNKNRARNTVMEAIPRFPWMYMKLIENADTSTSDTQARKKYHSNGKSWYFGFDDDKKEELRINPVTCSSIYCKEDKDKEGNDNIFMCVQYLLKRVYGNEQCNAVCGTCFQKREWIKWTTSQRCGWIMKHKACLLTSVEAKWLKRVVLNLFLEK